MKNKPKGVGVNNSGNSFINGTQTLVDEMCKKLAKSLAEQLEYEKEKENIEKFHNDLLKEFK